MRRLEIQDEEITRLALQDEILRSEESRYDHRLQGILMICFGFSCYDVADLLGHSPKNIHYWVQRFEESGFAGLQEAPRPGRPSSLDEPIYEALGGICAGLPARVRLRSESLGREVSQSSSGPKL